MRSTVAASVVLSFALGATACVTQATSDAGDGGPDAACVFGCDPSDGGATEAGDAPADGPAADVGPIVCTDTLPDIRQYWDTVDNIRVLRYDSSPIGREPPTGVLNSVFNPALAAPEPEMRMGSCVAYATDSDGAGSTARAEAHAQDLGPVRLTHDAMVLHLTFMASFGVYGSAETPFNLTPTHAIAMEFPGAGPRVAGMASLTLPPLLAPSMVRMATTVGRTRDFTIGFDPQASTEHMAFGVEVFSGTAGGPTVLCAVPACSGTLTVPAALLARYAVGETIRVRAGYRQSVAVGPATRTPPLYYQIVSLVSYRLLVE